jgi:hypothetical protein
VSKKKQVRIRLLFVDEGGYHDDEVTIPADVVEKYDRLIDVFMEDEGVQKSMFVDVGRLCSAVIVEE